MKSSAPMRRPSTSSISSSFEVRKITGNCWLLRMRFEQLHAVHARHLDVEDAEVGRRLVEALERRGAVGIGLDLEALGFEQHRHGGEDVAVVVDQGDVLAHGVSFS